jgi:outer membrane protein assembly factor BamD
MLYIAGCSSSGGNEIKTDDPEKAYEAAKRKFDHGDYLSAIEDFSFIKIKFPGTAASDKIQYYLAESYYMRGEYLLAAYEFETFLKNYPLSPLFPDAKYGLGLTYYRLSPKYSLDQEYTKYAINELQSFVELFPNDKNAAEAANRLKELRDKLAYKDYSIGLLYMKLDNYKSAGIYFENVYENYIDSDWAGDAMLGHAEALINGKKNAEALKVLDKFYKLFPKSKLKSKADNLRSLAKNN